MSYQVLARKYRPQRFSEVIGQEHVTRTLKNAIEQQRIAHGYIFSGHRGIGKTTIARILAMALNCRSGERPQPEPCGICDSCVEIREGRSVDVIEIDAATNRGIDEIRELREAARYRPARDRFKIYILDEAHQITDAAFNALLKTLEEPPAHIVFMMATTQPEDIPQTIRSRCQHFSFHAVGFEEIVGQLKEIAEKEGIKAEDEAIAVLAEAGDGSMRDALSIMDQAIACCGEVLTAEVVRGLVGTVSSEIMERLLETVAADSSQEALKIIDKLVNEGQSPGHFARQLVRFLRNCVVAKVSGTQSSLLQISTDEQARVGRVAERFSEEDLTRFLQIALRTYDELGYKQEQRFHLELGILKMVHAQRLLPVEELLSQQPVSKTSAPTGGASSGSGREPAGKSATGYARQESSRISPFENDRARKSSRGPEMAAIPAVETARAKVSSAVAATAVVAAIAASESEALNGDSAQKPERAEDFRHAVLSALEQNDQSVLANLMESGEWSLEGSELLVKVAMSEVMIGMSFGPEPKRITSAAASEAAGRSLKVKLISGGNPGTQPQHRGTLRGGSNGSARGRALDDPLVQYMQKKFGAEIRTVIDQHPDGEKNGGH